MNVSLVSLVSVTAPAIEGVTDPESLIVYCARVSSPNQLNPEKAKLLRYLIQHKHWSPFEMVDLTLEVRTSRAIAAQILRHRSFSVQEFSQRYSPLSGELFEPVEIRMKNPSGNRQSSQEVDDEHLGRTLDTEVDTALVACETAYHNLLNAGAAPESARMVLPLCTKTRMYMKGSVRSWIHYFEARCTEHAQKEHRLVAEAAKDIFCDQFPVTAEALGWVRKEVRS